MSNGDPIGSEKPRGKSNAARKGRYDGGYTGTEQRLKDKLMQQFRRTGEGPGAPSEAYRNAPCWCECGRLKSEGKEQCAKCLGMDAKVPVVEVFDSADTTHSLRELMEISKQPEPYATGAELARLLK